MIKGISRLYEELLQKNTKDYPIEKQAEIMQVFPKKENSNSQ